MFNAKRPVLIFGAGILLAGACKEAVAFAHSTGIPVAPTWGGLDIMPHDDPLFIGSFGTHGTRYGNFAVQNSDLIISIGSRLDSKSTGTPVNSFARGARIIMVDIDQTEIDKFQHVGLKVEGICEDAKSFLTRTTNILSIGRYENYPDWYARIKKWKAAYPICPPEYSQEEGVNPYVLVKALARQCVAGDIIVSDTGCTVAWLAQAFDFKADQRFIHAWNQTPMGYGLPAAIGAHYASGKRIILVTGDGSFQMQNELATVAGRNLPIKIILLNNAGHAMCRQTEREWFNGEYKSTAIGAGGLTFPHFRDVAVANRIGASILNTNALTESVLRVELMDDYPYMVEVKINPDHDVVPKLHANSPLEDLQPYLPRDEFAAQMIVPLWEK